MSTPNDPKPDGHSSLESAALTSGAGRTNASGERDASKETGKTKAAEEGTVLSKVAVEDRMAEFDERFESVDG